MSDWIAETELVGVTRDGERIPITVAIGRPCPFDDEPESTTAPQDMMCPVAVRPWREQRVGGIDSFQALCQAMHLVRQMLRSFEAEGGRVYAKEGGYRIDVQSPELSPMMPLVPPAWDDPP